MIKVSDNIYNVLSDIASKRGVSINDCLQEIINVYMGGGVDKAVKQIVDRDITLIYDGKCSKCGKVLKAGEKAHFTKYVYHDGSAKTLILCPDCFINSDPLLWRKYMKVKEYETIMKQLKAECDRLAQQLSMTQVNVSMAQVKRELISLWNDISHYLRDVDKNVEKYEELLNRLDELVNKVSELEALVRVELRKEKKREVTKYYEGGGL